MICPQVFLKWLRRQYFGREDGHLEIDAGMKKKVSEAAHALNNAAMAHQGTAQRFQRQAHAMMMIVKGHRDVLG